MSEFKVLASASASEIVPFFSLLLSPPDLPLPPGGGLRLRHHQECQESLPVAGQGPLHLLLLLPLPAPLPRATLSRASWPMVITGPPARPMLIDDHSPILPLLIKPWPIHKSDPLVLPLPTPQPAKEGPQP